MLFWKEHPALRIILMAVFAVAGLALVIYGWTLTGQLTGLYIMLGGLVCLLVSLWLYNRRFATPREKRKKQ